MPYRNYGTLIIILLCLTSFLFWLITKPIALRISSVPVTIYSLGQLAAILGITLFSIALVLSTRKKWLDKLFKGLNHVYIVHHMVGGLAFVLLLFHPMLLSTRYLQLSFISALNFILPEGDFAKDLGVYALILLAILLIITFFIKLKYENWKFTHKFLGLALFLGSLHAFLIPSDITQNIFLKYYLLTLVTTALSLYFYNTVLEGWTRYSYTYKVIDNKILKNNIVEIKLEAEGKKMHYESGQFVFVKFDSPLIPAETHPFSISSDYSNNQFKITIKTLGDFTNILSKIQSGDKVRVDGPYGFFNFKNVKNNKQVWISGGIGITPFLGMAKEIMNDPRHSNYKIDFLHCIKNNEENIINQELIDKINTNEMFNYIKHCSEDMGRISVETIKQYSRDFSSSDFLICGPPSMNQSLKKDLKKYGISSKQIHIEEFNLN